jgi:hypothetical protein
LVLVKAQVPRFDLAAHFLQLPGELLIPLAEPLVLFSFVFVAMFFLAQFQTCWCQFLLKILNAEGKLFQI